MNERYAVRYTPEARDDLREIYSYIAFTLKVPDTAAGQINRIRKEIRSLDFMPFRYSVVDWEPWKSMHMHKVSVDHFVVYYTVERAPRTVTVVRIFYGGRNVEDMISAERKSE